MSLRYHVYGTVDDDQVLSLRFGDAAKEVMSSHDENVLADNFWKGDQQLALIETFSRGNESVDFELEVSVALRHVTLHTAKANGWTLDPRSVAGKLNLALPPIICDHLLWPASEPRLQSTPGEADTSGESNQEDQHAQGSGSSHRG